MSMLSRREMFAALGAAVGVGARPQPKTATAFVSVDNGDRGTVYDANGVMVKRCLSADLETGCCVVYELDETGRPKVDKDNSIVRRKMVYHAAPLRFERNVELERVSRQYRDLAHASSQDANHYCSALRHSHI